MSRVGSVCFETDTALLRNQNATLNDTFAHFDRDEWFVTRPSRSKQLAVAFRKAPALNRSAASIMRYAAVSSSCLLLCFVGLLLRCGVGMAGRFVPRTRRRTSEARAQWRVLVA